MTHFKTILRIALVLFIIVCAVFAIIKMQNRSCSGVQVIIEYSGEQNILSEKEVIQILHSNQLNCVGEKLKEINLEAIKIVLSKEIYIKRINKINFSGTKLVIEITLREMLVYVFPLNGVPFFVDTDGFMIPFSPQIKEKLIIANGNISVKYLEKQNVTDLNSKLKSIYLISSIIQKDTFYANTFKQIFINNQNIIELVPADGSLTILFGDEIEAEEKLFKLKEIYNSVLPFSADKKYSLIDVRFKNRVIAKKANI